jgi:hypothetical protein
MKTSIRSLAIITLTLVGFALSPKAQAVSPSPDGGYPGFNTAEGQNALFSLDVTAGLANTAVGWFSLFSNTAGSFNTATGAGALLFNTGDNNAAVGAVALLFNLTGSANTAIGNNALMSNSDGNANTAVGYFALLNNSGFGGNTAVGAQALDNLSIGGDNTALGRLAGTSVTTASNVICIGSGVNGADVDNTCFIGNIRDVTTQNGDAIAVVIDSAGQLGTVSSSRRFKKEVKPIEKASESILALNPVTFHYTTDKTNTPQFGLIAEEVAQVNPDLVVRDNNGDIYTVRYDAVNAMLLNEFLKEHRKVEELKSAMAQQQNRFEATVAQQRKATEAVIARLNEQEARIQKVSEQVELSKLSSQMFVENQ